MRQRSAVRTSMDKPRSVSSAGEAARMLARRATRKAANGTRSRAPSMTASRNSAGGEAQQPADDRRLAGLGLGVHLEGELATSEYRRVERAAPQTRVCLGKIVEAAVGQRLVNLDRKALAWALRPLDDQGAPVTGAHLGNLGDGRQRVARRVQGGALAAERGGTARTALGGA